MSKSFVAREIGEIHNNISCVVVVFFTFVDMVFAHGPAHNLSNMFLSLLSSVCFILVPFQTVCFLINHMYIKYLHERGKRNICPVI